MTIAEVAAVAQREFRELSTGYPVQGARGGTLLLGKHYAAISRGILMLGINPGGAAGDFYTGTYSSNCLVDDDGSPACRYWMNARTIFNSSPTLGAAMSLATFAFCCPFRTPNWSGQPARLRDALVTHSRPILQQLLADCAPSVVIVAGVAGEKLFRLVAGPTLSVGPGLPGSGDVRGTYQWRAYRASLRGSHCVVAQIPHLSRANAKARLEACGSWLAGLVKEAASPAPGTTDARD